MRHEDAHHTNIEWHPYAELGSFFRLQNAVLFQSPMNIDGSRDREEIEIDWAHGVEDGPRLRQIVEELASKG